MYFQVAGPELQIGDILLLWRKRVLIGPWTKTAHFHRQRQLCPVFRFPWMRISLEKTRHWRIPLQDAELPKPPVQLRWGMCSVDCWFLSAFYATWDQGICHPPRLAVGTPSVGSGDPELAPHVVLHSNGREVLLITLWCKRWTESEFWHVHFPTIVHLWLLFRRVISVTCPVIVLKFDITVFTGPYFRTLCANWHNFFFISKKFGLWLKENLGSIQQRAWLTLITDCKTTGWPKGLWQVGTWFRVFNRIRVFVPSRDEIIDYWS